MIRFAGLIKLARQRRVGRYVPMLKVVQGGEDADKARAEITVFERDYGAKFPKAVAKIVDDADVLLESYHYPAEHWIHLRTTNPIESTFTTVHLRSKVTKGPGSRAAGLAMAFQADRGR